MKLSTIAKAKLDSPLREKLSRAKADDRLRVIFFLQSTLPQPESNGDAVKPADFASRRDFRAALIEQKKAHTNFAVGDTILGLRQLELEVAGGEITHAVVAEGTARSIVEGLDLPGVRNAIYNARIIAPRPRRTVPRKIALQRKK